MSRKRKRKRNGPTKPEAVAAILSALDGYSNAAAFLGEDSVLLSSGTFHRSGLTSQTELLTVTYRENWIAKRIIDMPCEDMTRAWYKLNTSLPEAALHDLYRLEARHSVKQEITNAVRWARLYGGSIALIVLRGEENRLDQPIDYDLLLPNCFQGLLVLDRAQGVEPSLEIVRDLDDPDFGLPMYYYVDLEINGQTDDFGRMVWNGTSGSKVEPLVYGNDNMGISRLRTRPGLSDRPGPSDGMLFDGLSYQGCRPFSAENEHTGSFSGRYEPSGPSGGMCIEASRSSQDSSGGMNINRLSDSGGMCSCRVKIHHSRVLRFIGRELPYMETVAENYWGASELEHIWDELQKRSATSANIAQLVFQANIMTLKMGDLGDHLAYGSADMQSKVMDTLFNENRLRTSYGIQLMSADDSLETHAFSFSGLSDVYESFMMDMAGAAEIPATKLFGRSPQGMNSTGEADLRNYYDMIVQMQERCLRPALEKLLPIMAISCWAYVPKDLEIIFQPVMTSSPAERAELVQKMTADVIEAFKCGLLTQQQAMEELQSRGERLGVYTKIRVES